MALVKCNASFSYQTAGGPRTIAVGELLDESDPAVSARRSFFTPTASEQAVSWSELDQASVTAGLSATYPKVYNVVGYGAVLDGATYCTAAIQAANDAAAAAGGGIVLVPAMHSLVALIDSRIVLDSNVTLQIDPGVTLRRRVGLTGQLIVNRAFVNGTRSFWGAAVAAGSTDLNGGASAAFVAGDAGKAIRVWGAGKFGAPLDTTIASVTDSTHAVLSTAALTAVTSQAVSVGTRDRNIAIIGGLGSTIDSGLNGSAAGIGQHICLFRRIDGLLIRGLHALQTSGKFFFAAADATNVVTENLTGVISSALVQHNGPLRNWRMENITATSGDDTVAVNPYEWSPYDDTAGDIEDGIIRNVNATTDASVVHILVGTGWKTRRILVDTVGGESTITGGVIVTIGDDTVNAHTMGGRIDDILVRNLSGKVGPGSLCNVTALDGGTIIFDGVTIDTDTGAQLYGAVRVPDLTPYTATIDSLVVRNVRWLATTNNANAVTVRGTVKSVELDGLYGTLTGTNPVPLRISSGSTIEKVTVTRIFATGNGGAVVDAYATTGVTLGTVRISQVAATGFSRLANLNSATEVHLSDITAALSYGTFDIGATGALIVRGHNLKLTGTTAPSITSGGTIRSISAELPLDLSITGLLQANGDMAFNTNAALSCGAGPAVSNGTNWKGLYSGATY